MANITTFTFSENSRYGRLSIGMQSYLIRKRTKILQMYKLVAIKCRLKIVNVKKDQHQKTLIVFEIVDIHLMVPGKVM